MIIRNMIIAKRIVPLKYEEDTLNFLNAHFSSRLSYKYK